MLASGKVTALKLIEFHTRKQNPYGTPPQI